MDPNRWDTATVVGMGVISRPKPTTEIPEGRTRWTTEYDSTTWMLRVNRESASTALESGSVIHTCEYYGLVYGWKTEDGKYRGTLLQYRNVTEDPSFDTADELLDWFAETSYSVVG